eukprot:scaffold28319_cov65-Cyclotella_meneghiniana.AAC.3
MIQLRRTKTFEAQVMIYPQLNSPFPAANGVEFMIPQVNSPLANEAQVMIPQVNSPSANEVQIMIPQAR